MTIISIEASQREKERKELKLKQKKQMEFNLVEKTSENYKTVSNASNDKKMIGLLQKVRQSDHVGVDQDFARFNGSHLYTQSIGKKQNKRSALLNENIDKLEQGFPNQLNGKKPRKRIIKKDVSKIIQPIKEERTFSFMLEQLGHERFVPSTNTLFGGLRNTSATYLKETT